MSAPDLYLRQIQPRIVEAMQDTPVILLAGPRQAGKTTLVRQLAVDGFRYLTLDDQVTLLSSPRSAWMEKPPRVTSGFSSRCT